MGDISYMFLVRIAPSVRQNKANYPDLLRWTEAREARQCKEFKEELPSFISKLHV